MTGVGQVSKERRSVDLRTASPDWRHDPRELADSVQRRAARRHVSRIFAAVAAVLLVVVGGWYLGFVTGRVAIPGLGTLTPHPADVSTFTVGDATYLMQVVGPDGSTVEVSRLVSTGTGQPLAQLPVPGPGVASVPVALLPLDGSDAVRATYAAVLPAGSHNVRPAPNDLRMSMTVHEGVVRTSPWGSSLLGLVVTLDPPSGASPSLTQPGLASIRWSDGEGHQHVSTVAR